MPLQITLSIFRLYQRNQGVVVSGYNKLFVVLSDINYQRVEDIVDWDLSFLTEAKRKKLLFVDEISLLSVLRASVAVQLLNGSKDVILSTSCLYTITYDYSNQGAWKRYL